MSVFSQIKGGQSGIEVFTLNKEYILDTCPDKVNLILGAYRTEEGKPWILPVVKKAKFKIAKDQKTDHEYLPAEGLPAFRKAAVALVLGEESPAILENRAFGIQTLSGTGALRLGAEFLAQVLGREVFYYPNPTWENHSPIFMAAGFKIGKKYKYWDSKNRCVDIDGLLSDLCEAPRKSVVLLHPSAHYPTGSNPTKEQWERIADVICERQLFPFFDLAYQGFASGDLDKDAYVIKYFVDRCFELFCAQSFAKNFGLYSERIGNLCVVQTNSITNAAILSRFSLLIRTTYSNPPVYGARIVATILNDQYLRKEWLDCITIMSSRIKKMRQALFDNLIALKSPGCWRHLIDQVGMFSYTGLSGIHFTKQFSNYLKNIFKTERQVCMLKDEYHIYMLSSGRINLCGLNDKNVKYVAESIFKAVTKVCDD